MYLIRRNINLLHHYITKIDRIRKLLLLGHIKLKI